MKTFIIKLSRWLSPNRSEKLHWYDCQFFYKKKGADMYIVDFNAQVGFKEQKDMLNARKVKKLIGYRVAEFPKKVLDNGVFYFKINAYLGNFSK
tara:strand:- start:183 stop:464 length:282 start_codon:yes stop_codon:yes gene_type:complete